MIPHSSTLNPESQTLNPKLSAQDIKLLTLKQGNFALAIEEQKLGDNSKVKFTRLFLVLVFLPGEKWGDCNVWWLRKTQFAPAAAE